MMKRFVEITTPFLRECCFKVDDINVFFFIFFLSRV